MFVRTRRFHNIIAKLWQNESLNLQNVDVVIALLSLYECRH